MLQELQIQNLAIVDLAEIHFRSGLNVISGETGAGKSIVIQAISLLLGGRSQTDLIRSGCESARVEGVIDIVHMPFVRERLKQAGFEDQVDELLIKRTFFQNGKNRVSINGELATLSSLHQICDGLIDLCGQHEHQSLLRPGVQLELLDRYGGLWEKAQEFKRTWELYAQMEDQEKELGLRIQEQTKKAEFLKFQIQEIHQAQLLPNEDEDLQREKQLLQTSEVRLQILSSIQNGMDSDQLGALALIRSAVQKAKFLPEDHSPSQLIEPLQRAIQELEEVSLLTNRWIQSIESADQEGGRLEKVLERLSVIVQLKKKYGSSLEAIFETLTQLEQELASFGEDEIRLQALQKRKNALIVELQQKGAELSVARRSVAQVLCDAVTAELQDLKMAEAELKMEFKEQGEFSKWTGAGAETIQLLVQTNRGEPARPLAKIVSGGELSRLMLAIRRVVSGKGGIGVYLFDEIDAGIGGQTAFVVGKKLKSVSRDYQVICITHLPQVACFGDHHLIVLKKMHEDQQRTVTEIVELTLDGRREELARMLGGPTFTQKSLENASEFLSLASLN